MLLIIHRIYRASMMNAVQAAVKKSNEFALATVAHRRV